MSSACADVTLEFSEEEMLVSSHTLRLASPVFEGMFASAMEEARNKRVKVDISSKEDFAGFYDLLLPGRWSPSKVTKTNVDALLVLSDYYQVEFLKAACEVKLASLPATIPRLLQAHKHGLKKQYARCVQALAQADSKEFLSTEDLKALEANSDIYLDLALAMRHNVLKLTLRFAEVKEMKDRIEFARLKAWSNIPQSVLEGGRRVDQMVDHILQSLLKLLQ